MQPPRTFWMTLPDALLVFDAHDAELTGEYELYAVPLTEQGRLLREWDAIKEGLTSTGRVPVRATR